MLKFVEDRNKQLSKAQSAYFMFPTEGTKGKPQIILGKRGVIYLEITIETSRYDAHSSFAMMHYNPVEIAANLISSLKNKDGMIVVDWLYNDVVTPMKEDLKYFKPSINIDGIKGGYVGEGSKTITPRRLIMKMDFRLVPNMTVEATLKHFEKHLADHGFKEWVSYRLYHNYDWSRTHPDEAIVKAAVESFHNMDTRAYIITTVAGSAPEYLFTKKLGIPIITSAPGYGGRIHAPNEFIEVQGIRKMIEFIPLIIKNWSEEISR
jgi:acetylornithine deacetylase/succinyl-diaminopimelate desuccinylase-like protein